MHGGDLQATRRQHRRANAACTPTDTCSEPRGHCPRGIPCTRACSLCRGDVGCGIGVCSIPDSFMAGWEWSVAGGVRGDGGEFRCWSRVDLEAVLGKNAMTRPLWDLDSLGIIYSSVQVLVLPPLTQTPCMSSLAQSLTVRSRPQDAMNLASSVTSAASTVPS